MARFGCLALAVVVAMALLIFIVFLWSGWLNRPVGHAPLEDAAAAEGRMFTGIDRMNGMHRIFRFDQDRSSPRPYPVWSGKRQNQDFRDLGIVRIETIL